MKPILIVVLAGLLAGCVTPQTLVSSGPSAELGFDLQSDAANGLFGQHLYIEKFDDPTCESKERGVIVAKKSKDKPISPIKIPTDRPITLALWYIRGDFGVNRQCSYTWTFTPVAGGKYVATANISSDLFCSVKVADHSGIPVNATHPVNSCVVGLADKKVSNGRSVIVHYIAR